MGKREKKIEVIQKYISGVAGNWPAYTYGRIPNTLIRNACNSYAGAVQEENILGLIDITVFGNGKKGMMFAEHKIYYDNGMLGNRGCVSYAEIYNSGTIPGALFSASYNEIALKELVSLLVAIEGETLQDKVNGAIDGIEQGLQSFTEVVEKGTELFDSFMKFFGENDAEEAVEINEKAEDCSLEEAKESYAKYLISIPEYWQSIDEADIGPIRSSEKINTVAYQLYSIALEEDDEIEAAGYLRTSAKFGNPQALYEYAKYAVAEDADNYVELYNDAQCAKVADWINEDLEEAKYCLEEAKKLTNDESLLNKIAWLEIKINLKEAKAIFEY